MIKKKYFQTFINTVAICTVLTGCGGRTANPVLVSQYGNQNKSCEALQFELSAVQGEIQRLLPDTSKTGKNVVLGVAGAFFLVPWFFMDFENAEMQEYQAYRQRYNHLSSIAISKNCNFRAVNYPSIEGIKKAQEEKS
jgi:multidrug efflux pump subunit AcrB